ncbi:hypothetical protein K1719_002186 [Acacia pycnantha]|nr:hypothetical protein K1719_002186 [Acacia pycnantha]
MEGFHPLMTCSSSSSPFAYTFNLSATGSSGNVSSSSSSTYTTPWMDCRIWSKLPPRILDRILAFLPPPAFFRVRCVCKRFYGLLFSNTFLQLYLQISQPHHWFIFFNLNKTFKSSCIYPTKNPTTSRGAITAAAAATQYCEAYLFDPYEIAWYRIPFPLVPSGFSPCSSSSGLICFVSDEAGPKTLILSNPIIGTITQLPPTIRPRLFPSIGLAISHSSIDLTVAGDDMISPYAVKNLTSESFHIDSSGFYSIWGTTSPLPRLCSLESGKMIHAGGRFYCMNCSPFSVLCHDISSNTWSKIQAPMRRFLRSPSLIESKGKLLLVAAVEKSKLNIPRSLRVWILQACGTTWVETERMPQQLYVQFAELEGGNGFDCVGHGEFIVLIIRGTDKVLLFDICRKRWQWIPPCPYVVVASSGGGNASSSSALHGFAYEPRLATPVTALLDQLALPF